MSWPLVAGSASPVGLREGVTVVADDSATTSPNLIAGANKPDVHLLNVNYGRDWRADTVTRSSGDAPKRMSPLPESFSARSSAP